MKLTAGRVKSQGGVDGIADVITGPDHHNNLVVTVRVLYGLDPHNNLVVRVLYGLDPHNNLVTLQNL